ncbi:hypothetical protein DUI87_08156 [Hirundo rustica rustica]|uniref:Cadherin domain-containing protein n=1 Tax=Hirundo rustica rustica TaxID=333673 RepID=A0A3M0KRN5_HIRRU|nr:hypothetical protein DUI87_08156 [Hirundo rustica rustica]
MENLKTQFTVEDLFIPWMHDTGYVGVIRTALHNMDREAREHYSVVIQAKDMAGQVGGLSGSTTVNITLTDVNDNPPRFPQKHYQLYVPESAQVGSAVGKIKANDADTGSNADMKYTIINGDGSGVFSISTDKETREGILSLKKRKIETILLHLYPATYKPLNYEKKKSYTLNIEGANTHLDFRFSHLGPFKDVTMLKIIVGDVDEPPLFTMPSYVMEVYENAKIGTPVGTVTAHDPDAANSLVRYFIDHNTEEDRYFTIDASTGTIKTAKIFDREETPWYNITVAASEIALVRPHKESSQIWASEYKRDMDKLDCLQCRVMKSLRLEYLSYEEMLNKLGMFSLEM